MELGDVTRPSSRRNKLGKCRLVYSVTNSQGFVLSADYFSKEVFSKELTAYKVVEKGQIAYNPSRINVGSVALQDKEAEVVVSPLYVVFSVDENRLNPAYLLRFLKSESGLKQIGFQSIGTVRNNLRYDGLSKINLVVPPVDEQERRLHILVAIERQLETARDIILRFDDLVKSRFVEMFGDPCDPDSSKLPGFPLKNICDLRIGPFGSALHKEDYIVGGHPVVNPSHIVDGRIEVDNSLTVGDDKFASMGPYHLRRGDVVLGRRGEIGRCAVVDIEGLLCGTGSMILRPHADVCSSDYLQRVVSFPSFSTSLERQAVGVTMKNLNAKIVGSAVVVLPPLVLQQEFAAFVAEVDKSRF
ncbi:restriction endonuclease subunit S, partial [Collinsella sp. D33t1_170424_A12]|uniref:restriction endonuclease subunit S n=1 Tax=Collinsella sp. D33t1_170424_A12 TaxID=2787135 RepID=UPI00189972A3